MSIIYKTSHYNVSHWEYLTSGNKVLGPTSGHAGSLQVGDEGQCPRVACPLHSSRWPEHPPNAFAVQSIELACRISYTGTCVEFKRYFLDRFSIVNPQWLPAMENWGHSLPKLQPSNKDHSLNLKKFTLILPQKAVVAPVIPQTMRTLFYFIFWSICIQVNGTLGTHLPGKSSVGTNLLLPS